VCRKRWTSSWPMYWRHGRCSRISSHSRRPPRRSNLWRSGRKAFSRHWCCASEVLMASPAPTLESSNAKPRVGLLGVGWIGANRLKALAAAQSTQIVCIADCSREAAERAAKEHSPQAHVVGSLRELFEEGLDGVVIATPSGQHAEQAGRALDHGLAVFCQKPLACTSLETRRVIEAARAHDRLLRVDFCYRTLAGVAELAWLVQSGALGEVYCADLLFHNAYGPDKPWFYDLRQSAGGCVMDLGIHLIDLLLWVLAYPPVAEVRSRLHCGGRLLPTRPCELEDHAVAEIQFASGTTARIACSWGLPAGRDA